MNNLILLVLIPLALSACRTAPSVFKGLSEMERHGLNELLPTNSEAGEGDPENSTATQSNPIIEARSDSKETLPTENQQSAAEKEISGKGFEGYPCPTGDWKSKLVIHHFDVGQGDSTFVRTPSGTTVLIDGGLPGSESRTILPKLKQCYEITDLDYVIVTHFHDDHYGGITHLLSEVGVREAIFDPGDDSLNAKEARKKGVSNYIAVASQTGKRKVPAFGESSIKTGDSVHFNFIAIAGSTESVKTPCAQSSDPNKCSIALTIRMDGFDYFIGGDLPGGGDRKADLESVVAEFVGDIDVLRANHHGSKTSSNAYFLEKLQPEQVIISVGNGGRNSRYHHPSEEVIVRMFDHPSIQNIFQTEIGEGTAPPDFLSKTKVVGDVIVITDGQSYSVNGSNFPVDSQKAFSSQPLPQEFIDQSPRGSDGPMFQPPAPDGAEGYSCAPRKNCSEMISCKEALFHLVTCGDTRLDGNGNGIPCEKLCGKP